ncbi:MAG: CoA-binding protein [Candidatus Rokubacteria bacterium]|nr:CoA-binding protein [Candidatus Rokubacteria bacterium]
MLSGDAARAWFFPRSILVVGASLQRVTLANIFLRRQREFGYTGTLHVLHPEASEIEGVRCVRRLAELSGAIDYAYVAIPGTEVPRFLADAAGRVRVAQVISSGFREVGDEGQALEAKMVEVAREGGVRLVGPNCMGSYSPAGRLTMIDGAAAEAGDIGVLSQSGVAACDAIKLGGFMGGRFSQVLSIGNCADVDSVEVYEHFVDDPATRVIGMYVEGLDRGAAFIEAVKRAEGRKPSVILKGGMTDQGRRSAVSHTGALATDGRIWQGLAAQFGLVLERSIEDFVGTLVGFSHWLRGPRHAGRRCCLVGPGGVLSVLGTDLLRRHGLDVPALDGGALERLEALRLPPGSSVRNPIDTPVGVMQAQGGRAFGHVLRVVAESGAIDWFVVHVSIQNLFSYLADPETALESSIAGFLDVAHEFRERARWGLVLRTNGDPALDPVRAAYRARAAAGGIPSFTRLEEAANAIAAFVSWAEHRERVEGGA